MISQHKTIWSPLRIILLFALVMLLSGCLTLPKHPGDATATWTPQPEETETALPTRTPAPTNTPTVTPLPHYISIQPEAVQGMDIVVWHAQRDAARQKLEELTDQFNLENDYGIKVKLVGMTSDGMTNDNLMEKPTGKDFPQLVLAGSSWLKKWQSSGLPMVMLQHYMDHPDWGFEAQSIDPIFPEMLDQEVWQGNQTALPLWHNPHFLFYNNAFGQILGFREAPDSLEALEEQICAAQQFIRNDSDPKNDGTGGWILSHAAGTLVSWMMSQYDSDLDLSAFPDEKFQEQFIGTVTWLRELFDRGCIWQSRLPEPYTYFSEHTALMYSGTFAEIQNQKIAFQQSAANKLDDWMLIPYPALQKEDGSNAKPLVFSESTATGIFTGTAEEQLASWFYVSWLFQDANATLLALAAEAWPVQQSTAKDQLVREQGDPKIYATLKWRQNLYTLGLPLEWQIDELVLSDGFAFAFNPGQESSKIPSIWDQIKTTLEEIKTLNVPYN